MMWIPITLFAALAQTVRNAAQRHLVADLGTLGATLVRFLYGLPFAVAWFAVVSWFTSLPVPAFSVEFLAWTLLGGVSQIVGTALLLRTMAERNFAVGVAYSKTEVVQVALFSVILLGDTPSAPRAWLGWLLVRDPLVVRRTLAAWRPSLFAGLMGAAASAGWFTAFAIKPVTYVRTLGLSEMVFSYVVSRRFFREHLTSRELAAIALLALGVVLITTAE